MFVTVLPNCLAPIIVQSALSFSNAILDVAALGFLGMGAQPPTPEWGTMLAEAREFILRAWWVVTFPGLAILVTVLAINLMGSGTFLVLVAPADPADPVPQAMVITGIVVAVSATALALNLMLKVVDATGRATLDGDGDEDGAS
jgi:hypothetical protein